jgi:hypothetical protein
MGPLRVEHFSRRNNKILPHQDASRDILRNALLSVQAARVIARDSCASWFNQCHARARSTRGMISSNYYAAVIFGLSLSVGQRAIGIGISQPVAAPRTPSVEAAAVEPEPRRPGDAFATETVLDAQSAGEVTSAREERLRGLARISRFLRGSPGTERRTCSG